MAINVANCLPYQTRNTDDLVWYHTSYDSDLTLLQDGYANSNYSTSDGEILYSHSCAHNTWGYNNRTYRILMDTSLRNAIQSKLNSGGLINLNSYVNNIPELTGTDFNGNDSFNVYGYICTGSSKTGSFEVLQDNNFTGSWPSNYLEAIPYNYTIPGVGQIADTVLLISNGWYSRGNGRRLYYPSNRNAYTQDQWLNNTWSGSNNPFPNAGGAVHVWNFGYYTINGIYSKNTGSKGIYQNNAIDVIMDAKNGSMGGINTQDLVNLVGAQNRTTYTVTPYSITNTVILAITDINMQDNTITVKFALRHDNTKSFVAFIYDHYQNLTALRIHYNYPVTTVHKANDTWQLTFINKTDFNPTDPNGTSTSALIWDSANNAVILSAGTHVNNSNGFSKIISRSQGTLQCSCINVNNTIRLTIAGYSITIPSSISYFDIRIIAINSGSLGYWRIHPPSLGTSHNFTLVYPETVNAPIATFQNELYNAIVNAIETPTQPMLFDVVTINSEYSITVTGVVRCDITTKDNKKYYSLSIYDVNGDFSRLNVKNGMYVTNPITITADLQVVNNTILIKAGMASIGYTNTSIGDITVNVDAIAVLLPTIATVSLNGARIGYATTTVNQSSFAFTFSAAKEEVEQTDDFVSHYLQ